jgi:hypothetical protein
MVLAALADMSFGAFAVAVAGAAALSMLVYWHASKHGNRHPTAWGVGAFLFAGLFVPLYFISYWVSKRRR